MLECQLGDSLLLGNQVDVPLATLGLTVHLDLAMLTTSQLVTLASLLAVPMVAVASSFWLLVRGEIGIATYDTGLTEINAQV